MSAVEITKKNFTAEVLESKGTVLIDFWADWCGPCRMMSPIIDEVSAAHPQVKVGKVNIDEEKDLALQYDITTIPTLMVFKNGEKIRESVGLISKKAVEDLIA